MSERDDWVPDTPEAARAFMDGLRFDLDAVVPDSVLPPIPADGEPEESLVPRSTKLPLSLDLALKEIADREGVTKSDLIRHYLAAAVAADRADHGSEVLVPISEVLRAIQGLGRLPRSA